MISFSIVNGVAFHHIKKNKKKKYTFLTPRINKYREQQKQKIYHKLIP
jgi:hypothetical protein